MFWWPITNQEKGIIWLPQLNNAGEHINIVRALARKRAGMTRKDLLTTLKITSGGNLSNQLNELEESDFITYSVPFGKKQQERTYRLIDEYSLFYLTWIAKVPASVLTSGQHQYWIQKQHSPAWKAWAGYSFEGICLKHLENIKAALGISGINTIASSWAYRSTHRDEKGTQIDLVIDRSDRCINLCEMKYGNTSFTIDKTYAEVLKNKRAIFKEKTKTTKTIFMTLITVQGTNINPYYEALIDSQMTMDAFFEKAA